MELLHPLLLALALALLGFSAVFLLARRLDNYGIVDVAWALGFAPLAVFHALSSHGLPARRLLIACMAVLWSLRLGLHLGRRVFKQVRVEDGRYRQLRADWGPNPAPKMFGFFLLQGFLLVLLGTPFLLASQDPQPTLRPLELAAGGLWLLAWLGESLADWQLDRFKAAPANRGRVCDQGLWAWSRHPNYFFESLIWLSFALFALQAPLGWLGLFSPLLITLLLLKVTGIRYTEEQLLRSKGEAYLAYRQRTSAFIPLPPLRSSNPSSPAKG